MAFQAEIHPARRVAVLLGLIVVLIASLVPASPQVAAAFTTPAVAVTSTVPKTAASVSASAAAMSCAQYGDPTWFYQSVQYTTQVCSNFSITTPNPAITMAIIAVFPGVNTGQAILDAAIQAGRQDSTLVLAPTFLESGPPGAVLVWPPTWRFGDYSYNGPGVYSFEVLDSLAETVAANRTLYPNLNKIVITGFSAGGQLVNRYAATNQMQQRVYTKVKDAIQFRYVEGAPSIYVYMDSLRWDSSTQTFADIYPSLNYYPYGLDYLPDWNIMPSADEIRTQYAQRNAIYIVGLLDTVVDGSLTQDAASEAQGINRLDRARKYYAHIQFHYGSLAVNHSLVEVPDVGHSNVYGTSQGRAALFDNWPATYTLSGTLTDNMGLPVPNFAVISSVGTITTNTSGAFSFPGLLPGAYALSSLAGADRFVSPSPSRIVLPPSLTGQTFKMAPVLHLAANRGKAGSIFTITVNNDVSSSPNKSIDVNVGGATVGKATSGASGGMTFYLQTSATLKPGAYMVTLKAVVPSIAIFYIDPTATTLTASGSPLLSVPDTVSTASQAFVPMVSR